VEFTFHPVFLLNENTIDKTKDINLTYADTSYLKNDLLIIEEKQSSKHSARSAYSYRRQKTSVICSIKTIGVCGFESLPSDNQLFFDFDLLFFVFLDDLLPPLHPQV